MSRSGLRGRRSGLRRIMNNFNKLDDKDIDKILNKGIEKSLIFDKGLIRA